MKSEAASVMAKLRQQQQPMKKRNISEVDGVEVPPAKKHKDEENYLDLIPQDKFTEDA